MKTQNSTTFPGRAGGDVARNEMKTQRSQSRSKSSGSSFFTGKFLLFLTKFQIF